MSWLVETLLLGRIAIRSESNVDSDEYHDLILVEQKISELLDLGLIDVFELSIMNYVLSNRPYSELEKMLSISRETISKYFRGICNRVSYALGGYFTDEGFMEHMKDKYNLTGEHVEKMKEHMVGKYRHTIRR